MSESNANPNPISGRCIYGYVLYLVSFASLVLYLIWAIIPSKVINLIGLTYIPSKYWSIAFPVFVLTLILIFSVCLYPSVNYLFTPQLNSSQTLTDKSSRKSSTREKTFKGIPPLSDLPLDFVSNQLYS